jgi:hypothetical protein
MADYRKILVLLLEGRSYREVVEIAGCSHRDVARVRQEVQERGLTSAVAVSDTELAQWFPDGRCARASYTSATTSTATTAAG